MAQSAVDIGARIGEYVIESLIARGGMGAVYCATHPVIGKRAAVKVMSRAVSDHPGGMERFVQEARAVNQIRHPNIVDVFSFGELEDGRAYMVMELVEGEVLADALRDGPLSIADAVAILRQLTSAVAAAHEQGVVHRDLKPDNAMLVEHKDGRRQVKLLDFGIAKLANPDGNSVMGKTQTGLVLGTPFYMSPEQARGKGVDHRTDIYALGCMMFEMLTGDVPYPSDNPTDAVIQHCQAEIPSMGAERAEISHSLDSLVRSMLAKTSDERPTLAEVIDQIDEITPTLAEHSAYATTYMRRAPTPTPIPAFRTPVPPPVRAVSEVEVPSSRKPLWAALALVVLVSAGIAGGILFLAGDEQPSSASAQPALAGQGTTLLVMVDVPEASVYVDGEFRGLADRTLSIKQLKAGTHRLEVRAEGALTQVTEVVVKADGVTRAAIALPAAPLAVKKTEPPVDAGIAEVATVPDEVTESERRQAARRKERAARRAKKANAVLPPVVETKSPDPKSEKPKPEKPKQKKIRKSGGKDRDYTIDPFAN